MDHQKGLYAVARTDSDDEDSDHGGSKHAADHKLRKSPTVQIGARNCSILLVVLVLCIVILVAVIVSTTVLGGGGDQFPTVTTHTGVVQGRTVRAGRNSTPIHEFLYIPYADPPVGDRRWVHSTLLQQGWGGVLREEGVIKCVQSFYVPIQGQEDCLRLSVRTPRLPVGHGTPATLPVIVWIHGGSLGYGYCEDKGYSADSDFTANVHAVTVNMNYRLDTLGFLSVPSIWEDGESYGNFGINDVIVALRWVQENIAQFGGDPGRVTIVGESSGATIVMAMVTAPKTDGLFNKAIALSPVSLWNSTYTLAHDRRPNFLQEVKCDTETSASDTRACLKSAPLELLINYTTKAHRGWGFYDFPMSSGILGESMDYNVREPTVVPFFPQELPDHPDLKRSKVHLIISSTAQEVAYLTIAHGENNLTTWEEAEQLLRERLTTFLQKEDGDLLEEIKQMYHFGEDSEDWCPQFFWDTLVTDIRATCPLNTLTERMNSSPFLSVSRMYIEHRPSKVMAEGRRWGSWHGWDTEAMFGFKYFMGTKYTEVAPHDRELESALLTLVREVAYDDTTKHRYDNTYLRNSYPWVVRNSEVSREKYCEFLMSRGFEGWGWQH